MIEILKKRNCTFDLKRLFDVIALVQDHLKSGVQQAWWGISGMEHIFFCLQRIAVLNDLARVCSMHVCRLDSAQSAHRIRVCAHRVDVMRRLSIIYVASFCWVTCLLQMWKALEHKRTNKRLDSAQRCCKEFVCIYTTSRLLYSARPLEGLSLFMLVLSQQFMPLIGNHHICPSATGSTGNRFANLASGFGSKRASSEWGHPEDCLVLRLKDIHTIHRCRVHHSALHSPQNGLVECTKVVDR